MIYSNDFYRIEFLKNIPKSYLKTSKQNIVIFHAIRELCRGRLSVDE